jgi:hypothetical protein
MRVANGHRMVAVLVKLPAAAVGFAPFWCRLVAVHRQGLPAGVAATG